MNPLRKAHLDKLIPNFSKEKLIHLYKQMWDIRLFEEKIDELIKQGKLHGTTHLCIGQEACAVGSCAVLRKDDKITSTHRGHGHSIAKGADMKRMMAELFGKATGYCKGKGGSMHIADVENGNLGSNGVVAGGIPIAVGSALTAKMKKFDYVTLSFFGDGATNEGSFHEALNLAAIWNLPVVFICENNQYGMSSPVQEMVNIELLSDRAKAYGFPGVTIDGNDMIEVINTVYEAVERARDGKGPTFIEMITYRFNGHSKSDKLIYRTREEEKFWYKKEPINRFKQILLEANILTESEAEKIKEMSLLEVEEALRFAENSPSPTKDDLLTDVYA